MNSNFTTESTARALAAYALNLLHGATLEPFEVANLIYLAASVGANVGFEHAKMLAKANREKMFIKDELEMLRSALAKRRPWWRKFR